jgi:hypothetical protein
LTVSLEEEDIDRISDFYFSKNESGKISLAPTTSELAGFASIQHYHQKS